MKKDLVKRLLPKIPRLECGPLRTALLQVSRVSSIQIFAKVTVLPIQEFSTVEQ